MEKERAAALVTDMEQHIDTPVDERWAMLTTLRDERLAPDNADPYSQIHILGAMTMLTKNHGNEPFMAGLHWNCVIWLQETSNQNNADPAITDVAKTMCDNHADPMFLPIRSHLDDAPEPAADGQHHQRLVFDVSENATAAMVNFKKRFRTGEAYTA